MAFYDVTADETQQDPFPHNGKSPLELIITGGFGSGTVVLQKQDSDLSWKNIPDASYTAAVSKIFNFAGPTVVRYVVSGSTTPTLRIEIS